MLPNECVGVMVDIQERLFPHIAHSGEVRQRVSVMIDGLGILDIPVLVTEQYPKGLGRTVESLQEKTADKPLFEKDEFSIVDNAAIRSALAEHDKGTVILFGIETHVCLLQSALDLVEHGYRPVLVADASSSRSPRDLQIALERLRTNGVIITTTESLLLELCRTSATPAFKEIAKLIK